MSRRTPPARVLTAVAVVAVLAVAVALVVVSLPGDGRKHVTASFPRTVSLYEGSDVRILGVPVGKVESVRPAGRHVTVRLWYDAKYDVPADAKAVIVAPAVVGDRFVQLTPVFRRGDDVLASDAHLGSDRTATPLELDEVYRSVDDLTTALGPDGANARGALTDLLDTAASNLDGQGGQVHATVGNLGRLTRTLDDNKDELFGTARQVERFVHALSRDDATVRRFDDSLASAADLLADERTDLAAALRNLGVALGDVASFVKENRRSLSHDVAGLTRVTQVLVRQRDALDETLTNAPTALTNLFHTYNPASGTLDSRANLGENVADLTSDPGRVVCGLLAQAATGSQAQEVGRLCSSLGGAGRAGALRRAAPRHHAVDVERVDRSLGGLLEVRR